MKPTEQPETTSPPIDTPSKGDAQPVDVETDVVHCVECLWWAFHSGTLSWSSRRSRVTWSAWSTRIEIEPEIVSYAPACTTVRCMVPLRLNITKPSSVEAVIVSGPR